MINKKYYPNIDDDTFDFIISLDPTVNKKYSRWLLNLYSNNRLNKFDYFSIPDLLKEFDSIKSSLEIKDILKYKSVKELKDTINNVELTHRQIVRNNTKNKHNCDLTKESIYYGVIDNFHIYVPLTYEASCKLGRNTNWCTATTESDTSYNSYLNEFGGNYFILINVDDDNIKCQFHYNSEQFVDRYNNEIDIDNFMLFHKNLAKFFKHKNFNKRISEKINTNKNTKGLVFVNKMFINIDMSNADFSNCQFDNCIFCACNLTDVNFTDTQIIKCIFNKCKLPKVNIEYTLCDFLN